MEVTTLKGDLSGWLKNFKLSGKKVIGFVPTMGALHEGHLSLIRKSRMTCDATICSIFVNPTQFNNPSDLINYPRMPEQDLKMLDQEGCNMVFMPSTEEMYTDQSLLDIDLGPLDKVMEGKHRPGHFKGVVTIVKKLFDLVVPHKAFFGEKDFQQLAVIRYMTDYFKLPVEVIGCPTLREPDGLAMSSRNLRLTKQERQNAAIIFSALNYCKDFAFTDEITIVIQNAIKKINSISNFKTEYLEIVKSKTLQPLNEWDKENEMRVCTAVMTSTVRLIDNIAIN